MREGRSGHLDGFALTLELRNPLVANCATPVDFEPTAYGLLTTTRLATAVTCSFLRYCARSIIGVGRSRRNRIATDLTDTYNQSLLSKMFPSERLTQ
jgi:hypothetical protein